MEAGRGAETYAGALVQRGEAIAEVLATGVRTKFGRTAELVRTAYVVSTQQKAVFRVVRNLAGFNGAVTVLLMVYAYHIGMPLAEAVPLRAHLGSGLGAGGTARDLHACDRDRGASPDTCWRASDPPLRGR